MEYREISTSGLSVSTVALGCWAIVGGENWGRQDESDSIATIRAALDEGINFFDTAEAYGNGYSEELLAKALEGKRKEVFIASKASPIKHSSEKLIQSCEASLRRLKTDYIDLYQLHWPSRDVPFKETVESLLKLRRDGKIRMIGLSNFGVNDLDEISEHGDFATNQIPYNLLWRAIEYEIAGKCAEKELSILPYSPLAQGLLTGKFASADDVPEGRARTRHFSSRREHVRHGEDGCEIELFDAVERVREICRTIDGPMVNVALAWLLYQPNVVSVLAGARNPEQVRLNAKAAKISLSDEILKKLSDVTETVKELIGPYPDMWEPSVTSRIR